jgi:hypothetical protein
MKRMSIFTITLLAVVSLTACAAPLPTPTQTSARNLDEEAEIRNVVENFGKRLQAVSLQSPNISQEMKEQYSEFVSLTLLETWMSNVSKVPGRIVSSPWPDRIEITTLAKEGSDKYVITGFVVEVTSMEVVSGGAAAKIPVHIVVQKIQGRWTITEYAESGSLTPNATSAVSLASSTSTASTPDTVTLPSLPTQYLEFSNLSDLQKVTKFPIWLPTYIPDNLPFYKGWISDYANGNENIRLLYSEHGYSLDANLKSLEVQMKMTDEIISRDSISHQFKVIALDMQEVQVRGQTGFTYWTRSVAAGNASYLIWREGTFNFSVSLFGAWSQPDESNPHGLDNILLMIAKSLQTVQ